MVTVLGAGPEAYEVKVKRCVVSIVEVRKTVVGRNSRLVDTTVVGCGTFRLTVRTTVEVRVKYIVIVAGGLPVQDGGSVSWWTCRSATQAKPLDTEKCLNSSVLTLRIASVCDLFRCGNPGRSRNAIRDTSGRDHCGRNLSSRGLYCRGRGSDGDLEERKAVRIRSDSFRGEHWTRRFGCRPRSMAGLGDMLRCRDTLSSARPGYGSCDDLAQN